MADMTKLAELLGDLDEEAVLEALDELLAKGASAEEGLAAVSALQAGMNTVGDLFESGEYFVGDLIFAGEILTEAIGKLKPILSAGTGDKMGNIVLGTVHGDLHDIGKNIFKNMVEIAGFEVYDIGIDQAPEAFVEKIKEVNPIIGADAFTTNAAEGVRICKDWAAK